jgi:transposase InsO family protein
VNVYPFIEAEKVQQHNVKRACELLKVSRSAYYAHRNGPSEHDQQDAELTEKIVEVHEASAGTYGAPRVHAELRAQGRRHSCKRVARLMRAAGRRGRAPRRWRTTTVPDPVGAATRPDLVARDFHTSAMEVNTRWCGDITYINTWEGWLYLATVIDLASRRVVGWATADHLRTDLVAQALTNAVATRRPIGPVIFHSDRGCQYTSAQFARLADQLGVRLSVGRKGQCWDNAVAESFFASIKAELLDRRPWPSRGRAEKAIFEWIEGWYNTRRRHSTLDYLSPAAYEATIYSSQQDRKVA